MFYCFICTQRSCNEGQVSNKLLINNHIILIPFIALYCYIAHNAKHQHSVNKRMTHCINVSKQFVIEAVSGDLKYM